MPHFPHSGAGRLANGVTADSDYFFWDVNFGPSNAVQTGPFGSAALSSESFTLTSTAATGAVPEPATWAMMLVGFGMVGFGMRYTRKQSARVTFA